MIRKKECTSITNGKVVSYKKRSGLDFPDSITVEYEVNNKKYQIEETVKLKSTLIKIGFIPIGQRKVPRLQASVGDIVEVRYNPNKPDKAYIVGNEGIMNA